MKPGILPYDDQGEESQDYNRLLQSAEWQERRREILDRDLHRCRGCGSSQHLQVHHRQYQKEAGSGRYRLPWDYADQYLVTLCDQCHSKGHQLYTIPCFTI